MRYITTEDGRSAPLWLIRTGIIILYPFIQLWAFLSTLVCEIGSAFWYARQECRIEHGIAARQWRGVGDGWILTNRKDGITVPFEQEH